MLTVARSNRDLFVDLRGGFDWEPLPDLGADAYVAQDSSAGAGLQMWFAGTITDQHALQVIAIGPTASRSQVVDTLHLAADGSPDDPAAEEAEGGEAEGGEDLRDLELVLAVPDTASAISGDFTENHAKDLAFVIRTGSLPVDLERQTVAEIGGD